MTAVHSWTGVVAAAGAAQPEPVLETKCPGQGAEGADEQPTGDEPVGGWASVMPAISRLDDSARAGGNGGPPGTPSAMPPLGWWWRPRAEGPAFTARDTGAVLETWQTRRVARAIQPQAPPC